RRIFPTLTVKDNVLAGAFGRGRAQQAKAYDWLCSLFPWIAERAWQPASQLSGGQQQILALARAMCSFPRLLLLDEPFLGLAPVWIGRISEAIREMQARGTTILMTEQMARPALNLATRGYVMRGGEIRRYGRKRAFIVSVLIYTAASLANAISWNVASLSFFRLVTGVGLSAVTVIANTYLSEVFPARVRGKSMAIVMTIGLIGIPATAWVARFVIPMAPWGWRVVFIWGALGMLVLPFAMRMRESPRWLLINGR
ncbi:MAG: MFS transporter, partial [Acidibrevibacterium sp.]|uniref:MFS transporter n=1 Tax=Acidibrevibacterium fodinaquatile TaxID=1969806 RepID=UPI0023A79666